MCAVETREEVVAFGGDRGGGGKTTSPYMTLTGIQNVTKCPDQRVTPITLLLGDGIGPEVISVAKNILNLAGSLEGIEFKFKEMPIGGAALDLTEVPLPEETLTTAQQSDVVPLGAIGG
ncbi:hypothetical protein E3N88_35531 [Mikania micrantha]|uniref:Isopropylmalate dehydrogenase-like domain-containing protein n=1 Tax=Mikania micrantha TaxID=192012 RepID=A0A5N6M1Q2_9ASTR|nr:hypothetical protein E3N88_35531 [Mikania micrantha]